MLDLMSLSSAVGVQWLREQGQTVIEDVEIVTVPSDNSALIALARDDVAAVVAVASQLLDLKPEVAGGRRTLAHLADIPGPWHVGRPGVPAATVARWRDALLAFAPDLKRLPTAPNSRLTPLSVADTQAVEAYAAHLRVQLAQAR
jgi:glutathione S-transferase